MNEADLTRKHLDAVEKLLPGAEALKHADRFNKGYPDATVTWHGKTSWWETKFYNDKAFDSPAVQRAQCKRLARQGTCYYVIYVLVGDQRHTRIVPPALIERWDEDHSAIAITPGFDYSWVANFIRNAHLT